MTMIQRGALLFGTVSLAFGALAFVPALAPGGMLWGLFMVDGIHALLHILTGIGGIFSGFGRGSYARLYFKMMGLLYGFLALLGFIAGGQVLGMTFGTTDTLLHLAVAGFSLYVGFSMQDAPMPVRAPAGVRSSSVVETAL